MTPDKKVLYDEIEYFKGVLARIRATTNGEIAKFKTEQSKALKQNEILDAFISALEIHLDTQIDLQSKIEARIAKIKSIDEKGAK